MKFIVLAATVAAAAMSFAATAQAQNYNPVVYRALVNQCHEAAKSPVMDDAAADRVLAEMAVNIENMSVADLQDAVRRDARQTPGATFMGGLLKFDSAICANKIGLAYKTGGVAAIEGLAGGGASAGSASSASGQRSSANVHIGIALK